MQANTRCSWNCRFRERRVRLRGMAWVLGAAVLVAASGCATMEIPEDKVLPLDAYSLKAESRGLVIAVNPLRENEISETFRTDLLQRGILPVLVVAENRTTASSFVLSKDKVSMVAGQVADAGSVRPKSKTAGDVMTIAGAALISLPLVVVGMKMSSDASVVEHNLGIKEFQSQTLDPGQSAHGYLYFSYSKDAVQQSSDLHVLIEATDTVDYQAITFDIPFGYVNH